MSGRAVSKARLVRTVRLSDWDSECLERTVSSDDQAATPPHPSPAPLMADSPTQGLTRPDLIPAPVSPPPSHADSESVRSSISLSSHSSVLVDMGKVVGLLRSYPGHQELLDDELAEENGAGGEDESDFDLSSDQFSESQSLCATCASQVKGQESEDIEDSLLGDPLVYATFVATVQGYSTETEPSRQPSVVSRNPSFKQNSLEAEGPPACSQLDKSEVSRTPVTALLPPKLSISFRNPSKLMDLPALNGLLLM